MNVLRSTLLLLAFSFQFAHAVKMDETTHDEIIQKLEMGIDGMDKTDPERNGIVLRLADLYSDRARLKALNEVEQNCKDCKGALNDRKKAISLYEEALPKTAKQDQGRIVLQVAHLYSLNDEQKKANQLYAKILRDKRTYSSEVRALAFMNEGEVEFRNNDFKHALKDFESARREKLSSKALVEYRIAWCQLNLGKTGAAINTLESLLRDPRLLATQTTDGETVDPSFVSDVSHDLAIFMAHGKVGTREIDTLKQLSPDAARKNNLHTLATETDRLGKKEASLIVWAAYVDEGDVKPNEKLEVQVRVANIYYDIGRLDMAANAYEKALDLWKKLGCTDPSLCDDLKARLRNFVTAWNKGQKLKPSENLFRAYVAYTQAFPGDTEMWHWGAIVGRSLGKHKEAAAMFHQAAVLAALELQKNANNKEMRNIFEGSLLAQIEMAEASKDPKIREAAYNYYLQINPDGTQVLQVRYQRAHVYYDTNRFQDAFAEFHYVATQPSKEHRDIRLKAADLALDCLVAMKDDKNLQVRSLEYARLFPERKTEYLKISRKASMNLVAQDLKNVPSTDKTDYKASLAALAAVNMDGADDNEKIKFYKNKVVIAQKANDLNAMRSAAEKLLQIKSLTPDDREWTLTQMVWADELQLNFADAYRLSTQMKLKDLNRADRELRLALLAELAGLSTRKHNEAYLKYATNVRSANLVRVTLIRESSNPWKEFDRQFRWLKQTPDLLAGISLEVFAKRPDYNRAQRLLHTTSIGRYAAGETLAREIALRDFHKFDSKIRTHRIYGYSDAAVQKTLKERLRLLNQSERQAQFSFRSHDWTLEILTLSELARENRRLYHDILSLPIPRRLSARDRFQYQQLLHQKSEPYLARAEKIELELSEMWGNSNSVQNLQSTYMTATPEMQRLYRNEIVPLAQIAPSGAKNRLDQLLSTPYHRVSQREILQARRDLEQNPFDVSKAERLRELESQGGQPAMVVYLDDRISRLKKGTTL